MKAVACMIASAAMLAAVSAQDPADGWMAYAVGAVPDGTERITRLEMKWKVLHDAKPSLAFYSPWFGMDPMDNLDLIQPVNPWTGDSWSMYTEHFRWTDGYNKNSKSFRAQTGQTLHGTMVYLADTDTYNVTQTIVETGETSFQIAECKDGEKFRLPYVVFEKVWRCSLYPPDEIVTFYDIVAECDGKDCAADIEWSAKVKDANCDMTAHIAPNNQNISITWDTSAASKYDDWEDAALISKNTAGWSEHL